MTIAIASGSHTATNYRWSSTLRRQGNVTRSQGYGVNDIEIQVQSAGVMLMRSSTARISWEWFMLVQDASKSASN